MMEALRIKPSSMHYSLAVVSNPIGETDEVFKYK